MDLPGRLIIRLHKYEAFIPTPLLTQWDRVDSLLTITPYMETLLSRTVPGIESATSVRLTSNITDLKRFKKPKSPQSARTIALIQYNSLVKDPMWALDVLDRLHAVDPSWQLLLVGRDFPSTGNDTVTEEYLARFNRRLGSFGDSVVRLGYRSDLPELFQDIGVILSSSQVEGAPVSIQEGVASGALPVIRDWPILKAIGATRQLYPRDWVVETPEEAATRILAHVSPVNGEADEVDPQALVISKYDASVTSHQVDQILFPFR